MAAVPYVGRFAPTPSGPLHFGSLIAAVASYLDAKAHQGTWLVRIEDVDAPRSQAGAADTILTQLEQYQLHWDGDVWFQTDRTERYQQALADLKQQHRTYYCDCTRAQIKSRGPYYTGYCRQRQLQPGDHPMAVRFTQEQPVTEFTDRICGKVTIAPEFAAEDFVLFRRDGLFTYQLSVVVDDIDQGVTDVVRGADLLTATSWQLQLWRAFAKTPPRFAHVPLVLNENGAKLSKQNHAAALPTTEIPQQLQRAFEFLGLGTVPLTDPAGMLTSAVPLWRSKYLP